MKRQILFSMKKKKNIFSLLSAEFAHSMVSVKEEYLVIILGLFSLVLNKIMFSINAYVVGTH